MVPRRAASSPKTASCCFALTGSRRASVSSPSLYKKCRSIPLRGIPSHLPAVPGHSLRSLLGYVSGGTPFQSKTSCFLIPGRLVHWRSPSWLTSAPNVARSLVSSPSFHKKWPATPLRGIPSHLPAVGLLSGRRPPAFSLRAASSPKMTSCHFALTGSRRASVSSPPLYKKCRSIPLRGILRHLPAVGLEPTRPRGPPDFESGTSTNFITPARFLLYLAVGGCNSVGNQYCT